MVESKKVKKRTWIEQSKYCVALGVLLLILCVLPAGMSRSAWMAVAISGIWVYATYRSWGTSLRKIGRKYKKEYFRLLLPGNGIDNSWLCSFQLKVDSANGRLLIWKVSVMAIVEKPFLGHGTGNFASAYGMAQEKYFSQKSLHLQKN